MFQKSFPTMRHIQAEGVKMSILSKTDVLKSGLDAAWLRNEVIMNNIANAETPGFKASKVEFENTFKAALKNGSEFKTKCTRSSHKSFNNGALCAKVVKNGRTSMRMDGNNVDIEEENIELARNTIYYYTLTEQLKSELMRLKLAITEGR